jgi:hypothetical protein
VTVRHDRLSGRVFLQQRPVGTGSHDPSGERKVAGEADQHRRSHGAAQPGGEGKGADLGAGPVLDLSGAFEGVLGRGLRLEILEQRRPAAGHATLPAFA